MWNCFEPGQCSSLLGGVLALCIEREGQPSNKFIVSVNGRATRMLEQKFDTLEEAKREAQRFVERIAGEILDDIRGLDCSG